MEDPGRPAGAALLVYTDDPGRPAGAALLALLARANGHLSLIAA